MLDLPVFMHIKNRNKNLRKRKNTPHLKKKNEKEEKKQKKKKKTKPQYPNRKTKIERYKPDF